MRDKERLQDYRFMPEPNLPPLYLYDNSTAAQSRDQNTTNVDEEIQNMPPLPRDVRNKLIKDYNLSLRNVYVLVVIDYLSSPLSTGTSYFLFVIFYPITLLILISLLNNCRMKTKG